MDMAAITTNLKSRLAELGVSIADMESQRREPLDADFADQAAQLETQDAMGGIEDARLAEVQAIHRALNRIASGSYGQCSICGGDIAAARLAALPTTTRCIACAG
ncbi:TraR/DksA family transcriptional regulator [Sandarakinorhabdus sp.]|uniref:TraR/DksA family transcriptional regulator n=1 Tax=Sandarakinorhabdus sp. TaxID=1916663 RepID=UPI00286D7400|nr:TraR/DksA family transcriptional regulator [Sandarakinorhabdus sp.]